MLKWLIIIVITVVVFVTLLLGLGYLLKEHETATKQLKLKLDLQSIQQTESDKSKQKKFPPAIETSLIRIDANSTMLSTEKFKSVKQNILVENLTCSSKKQCVLVDIEFSDLSCIFAINTIGASLLGKSGDDLSLVGKCPSYPQNSQLSCESNLCTYGVTNN